MKNTECRNSAPLHLVAKDRKPLHSCVPLADQSGIPSLFSSIPCLPDGRRGKMATVKKPFTLPGSKQDAAEIFLLKK